MEQSRFDRMDDLRTLAAITAVAVGVLICAHQHHFLLTWSRRSVYLMSRHRCGELMMLVTFWALAECLNNFIRT